MIPNKPSITHGTRILPTPGDGGRTQSQQPAGKLQGVEPEQRSASVQQRNSSNVTAIQVLETRLAQRLQAFTSEAPASPYKTQAVSAEAVANKVLGFVEARLEKEASNGAGPERLSALLEQAKAGIAKGYGEAREELEARGMLQDNLETEIQAGYDKIGEGLDSLQQRFVDEDGRALAAMGNDLIDSAGRGVRRQESDFSEFRPQGLSESVVVRQSQMIANDVGISLKTRDGDTVTIRLGAAAGQYAGLTSGQSGGTEYTALGIESFYNESFQLEIDGELDAGEMEAIQNLMSQVGNIAGSFFQGDIGSAFETALDLNVDMGELASYAVSLTSTQYEEVGVAYQRQGESPFKPLVREVPLFENALAEAEKFADAQQLIRDMVAGMLEKGPDLEEFRMQAFLDFSVSMVEELQARRG